MTSEPQDHCLWKRDHFKPQHIVIGHANHPAVTHTYPQLLDIITQRGLRTVTLADVYTTPV